MKHELFDSCFLSGTLEDCFPNIDSYLSPIYLLLSSLRQSPRIIRARRTLPQNNLGILRNTLKFFLCSCWDFCLLHETIGPRTELSTIAFWEHKFMTTDYKQRDKSRKRENIEALTDAFYTQSITVVTMDT